MNTNNEAFILKVADSSVSIDGPDLADRMLRTIGDKIAYIAEVIRALGPAIHPLEWPMEKLEQFSPLLAAAEKQQMTPREVASRVLSWLTEAASDAIYRSVTGDPVTDATEEAAMAIDQALSDALDPQVPKN